MYKIFKEDEETTSKRCFDIKDARNKSILTSTRRIHVNRINYGIRSVILIDSKKILKLNKIMNNLAKLFPDILTPEKFFVNACHKELENGKCYKFDLLLSHVIKTDSSCYPVFSIHEIHI